MWVAELMSFFFKLILGSLDHLFESSSGKVAS